MLQVFSHTLTMHTQRLHEALVEYYIATFAKRFPRQYAKGLEKDYYAFQTIANERATSLMVNLLLEGVALANARTHMTPSLRSLQAFCRDIDPERESELAHQAFEQPEMFSAEELFEEHVLAFFLSALLEGATGWYVNQFMDELYNLLGRESFQIDNYTGIFITHEMFSRMYKKGQIILPFIEPLEWKFVGQGMTVEELEPWIDPHGFNFVVQGQAFILPETFSTMVLPDESAPLELYLLREDIIEKLKKL